MKKITTILLSAILLCASQVSAQKATVKGKPTVKDKFPKKSGNMMFSKSVVQLGKVFDNEIRTDTVYFYNYSKNKISLSFNVLPEHISVELGKDMIKSESESYIIIHYDASKKKDYGMFFERIILKTNDTQMPNKSIAIASVIEPYFPPMSNSDSVNAPKVKISKTVFNYDTIKAGDTLSRSIQLFNEGENGLKLLSVKSNCGCLKIDSIEKRNISKGESLTINFTFNSTGITGANEHKIIIYTNSPFNSKIEIVVRGEILPN